MGAATPALPMLIVSRAWRPSLCEQCVMLVPGLFIVVNFKHSSLGRQKLQFKCFSEVINYTAACRACAKYNRSTHAAKKSVKQGDLR